LSRCGLFQSPDNIAFLRITHHRDGRVRVGDGRRSSRIVDHVQDAAGSGGGQEDRKQVVHAFRRQRGGYFECICSVDVHSLIEEAVASKAISVECPHIGGDLEGSPAIDTGSLHPRSLTRRVIGHLVLEEDVRAPIAGPDDFVFLIVLDEEAVAGYVVSGDDEAGVGGVVSPTHASAVIGTPRPDVIEN
jgi:hypothetical protein